jgi:glycosyltransferase involved in cell wall biosynthesis
MQQLEAYRKEILKANKWLCDHNEISVGHRLSLDQDITSGVSAGQLQGVQHGSKSKGDLNLAREPGPFLRFDTNQGLRLAFVSQSFPPANDAGIARWTSMMATGFAERGHNVHVLAKTTGQASVRFADGYWLHLIAPESKQGEFSMWKLDLPESIADWAEAVKQELRSLRTFGVDVVSFPIWDVEGAAIVDEPDIGVVMSLHTTYAMAREFKPEWQARPLYDHFFVKKVIRQERRLLENAPVVLANSDAIVADLTNAYGVDFSARTVLAPHGTYDPFVENPARRAMRNKHEDGILVGYVGRFEPRKGVDIAIRAVAKLLKASTNVKAIFAGDSDVTKLKGLGVDGGAENLFDDPRVTFAGLVSRHALDDIYAACHVVIMPSRYESFGLVAIEAMAAGAVVVAMAAGGLREIVRDNETGFLVPPGDSAADVFADRLIELARNATLWASMSAAARADFGRRFTVETMVEKAEAAYLKAAAMRGKGDAIDAGTRDVRLSSSDG